MTPLPLLSIFNQLLVYANDIALLVYTVALVVWGCVFALFWRKKWRSWRHLFKEPLSSDEWILLGIMLTGLVLGIVYMFLFLHGRPPGFLHLAY